MSTTENGAAPATTAVTPPAGGARLTSKARKAASTNVSAAAVNLLSPWVMDELRVRKLRGQFVAGLVVLLVVIGAAWTFLRFQVSSAEDQLAAEQARTTTTQDALNALAPVRAYVGSIQAKGLLVQSTMAAQVAFADVFGAIDRALPDSATIDTLSVTLPETPVTAENAGAPVDPAAPAVDVCPGPDPFGSNVIVGCIQIAGTAASRQDVSNLVIQLARSPLFAEPFVSTTTRGEEGDEVSFAGTIGLTLESLSGNYDDLPVILGLAPEPTDATSEATTGATTGENP